MLQTRASLFSFGAVLLVGLLLAAPQSDFDDPRKPSKVVTAVDDDGDVAAGVDSMTFVRGMEVPVAAARPVESGAPKTVLLDTYLDWDFGTLVYLGENGSVASVPAPKNWEFRHAQLPQAGGGMVALCFQPGTGLAFLLDGEGKWAPIQEPSADLVVGDYDVTLAIDVDRVFALRFDRFSGRSWSLEEDGWAPIAGNLQGWPSAEGSSDR